VILLLGSAGIVLTVMQLFFDVKALRGTGRKIERPIYEVAALDKQGPWGSLEIWVWLCGLFLAIHLLGFFTALPVFVFAYIKLYGGRWVTASILARPRGVFFTEYLSSYSQFPWPKPWPGFLFSS
jgi:hypothetical protein